MSFYRCAMKLLTASNGSGLTTDLDFCSHGAQLFTIGKKAGLVDTLRNPADPLCQGHANTDLTLHIRGEPRIWHGFYRGSPQTPNLLHPNGIVILNHSRAHFPEFCRNAVHVLRNDIFD